MHGCELVLGAKNLVMFCWTSFFRKKSWICPAKVVNSSIDEKTFVSKPMRLIEHFSHVCILWYGHRIGFFGLFFIFTFNNFRLCCVPHDNLLFSFNCFFCGNFNIVVNLNIVHQQQNFFIFFAKLEIPVLQPIRPDLRRHPGISRGSVFHWKCLDILKHHGCLDFPMTNSSDFELAILLHTSAVRRSLATSTPLSNRFLLFSTYVESVSARK